MFFGASEVSGAALREENARRRDFFTLLYFVHRRFYSPTNVEWRLMEYCLDEINYKYADFSFLVAFASALALRNRKGHSFVSRYRFPFYVGLVGYDNGLRNTNPCPSLTFWNSVTLLESPLGEAARALHAPTCFYEVGNIGKDSTYVNLAYLPWLWESGNSLVKSLFLQSLFQSVLGQSCWRQRNENNTVTSLVVCTRFFKWNVFDLHIKKNDMHVAYAVKLSLPRFNGQLGLCRSYRNREMILERASFGGQLWYGTHFALMHLLNLHDQNNSD